MKQVLTREELAGQMREFLGELPASANLDWARRPEFLGEFEAPRLLLMRELLMKGGIAPDAKFEALDFGYLHGLVPEFLHRFFPGANFTVYDRPGSPIFSDEQYLGIIRRREYLKLMSRDIHELAGSTGNYQVIVLGEIIEHLDPTQVAGVLRNLRKLVKPGGLLLVTTPNGAGFYNWYMTVSGGDVVLSPPIPDPVMGHGHIHLWSERVLRETAAHCGWGLQDIRYYHGREGEKFAEMNARWLSLKSQVFLRTVKILANSFPKLRGFLVASFAAEKE